MPGATQQTPQIGNAHADTWETHDRTSRRAAPSSPRHRQVTGITVAGGTDKPERCHWVTGAAERGAGKGPRGAAVRHVGLTPDGWHAQRRHQAPVAGCGRAGASRSRDGTNLLTNRSGQPARQRHSQASGIRTPNTGQRDGQVGEHDHLTPPCAAAADSARRLGSAASYSSSSERMTFVGPHSLSRIFIFPTSVQAE